MLVTGLLCHVYRQQKLCGVQSSHLLAPRKGKERREGATPVCRCQNAGILLGLRGASVSCFDGTVFCEFRLTVHMSTFIRHKRQNNKIENKNNRRNKNAKQERENNTLNIQT